MSIEFHSNYIATGYNTADGLDVTGKSTLLEMLHGQLGGIILRCPPEWMKKYRSFFNKSDVRLRFMYYAFGNYWLDKFMVKPYLEQHGDNSIILQDRSWLSTFAAHDLRGAPKLWLNMGLQFAKKSIRPQNSFIIHVDSDVRRERMMSRGIMSPHDLENFKYEEQINQKYMQWGGRLAWNTIKFDNTHLSPDEACSALAQYICE